MSQLTPADMPDRAVPIVHTTDQTLVLKGLPNVIGYSADEKRQHSGWSAVRTGLDFSSMTKLLDPTNIMLQNGYYTVINNYGPHGNSWYCTSPTGPCGDFVYRGALGFG